MTEILNLEDYKIKGINPKGSDTKDGIISNKTLSGKEYNIVDFIDYKHELKLQYLSISEVKTINSALMNLVKESKKLSFSTQVLEKFNYVSFSDSNITEFTFDKNINVGKSDISGLFDMTINLVERVIM